MYGRLLLDPERADASGVKIERGPLALDVLLDPPGHHRFPSTDDEIV